jgi:hypothetical protein
MMVREGTNHGRGLWYSRHFDSYCTIKIEAYTLAVIINVLQYPFMKVTLRFTGLILLLTIFYSCNHGYKFWEVSKFHFVDTALKDNDAIKLLYSSRAPDNNEDKKYYIQMGLK